MIEELCSLCSTNREDHLRLQAEGMINHEFNLAGDLIQIDRSPKVEKAKTREVMVVPGVDIILRTILIEKGILSEADFDDAGAYGGIPRSDQRLGPAPGPEGSVRPSSGHP